MFLKSKGIFDSYFEKLDMVDIVYLTTRYIKGRWQSCSVEDNKLRISDNRQLKRSSGASYHKS